MADNLLGIAGRTVPILVAGQATGATVATAVAQRSTRDGDARIAMQILICPLTDADTNGPSYREPANQVSLTRDAVQRLVGRNRS